ncbi:hypothetical protein [Paenibacillus dakarensis]|uniref:hypothetical protein n=1 Tax=Paenibacillus dakarensis TaxID=1527293 RepID=UPI0006D56472|nr:hypothetical protein [Paenibacillus dakarensis]
MSKQIQAYFRTESEAEGARTSLQTYHVDQLEVGQLQESLGQRPNLIVPLVPWSLTGTGGGAMGTGTATGTIGNGPGAVVPVVPRPDDVPEADRDDWVDGDALSDSDYDDLKYVLSCKVSDAEYEEIVQVLRRKHAYVERFE